METKQIQKEGLGINALIEEVEELNKYKDSVSYEFKKKVEK